MKHLLAISLLVFSASCSNPKEEAMDLYVGMIDGRAMMLQEFNSLNNKIELAVGVNSSMYKEQANDLVNNKLAPMFAHTRQELRSYGNTLNNLPDIDDELELKTKLIAQLELMNNYVDSSEIMIKVITERATDTTTRAKLGQFFLEHANKLSKSNKVVGNAQIQFEKLHALSSEEVRIALEARMDERVK